MRAQHNGRSDDKVGEVWPKEAGSPFCRASPGLTWTSRNIEDRVVFAGISIWRVGRTHNESDMRVQDGVLRTKCGKKRMQLRVEAAHERIKGRNRKIGGWKGGERGVIRRDLWSGEAERVIKRRGDVDTGRNELRKDSLFATSRIGVSRRL